MHKGLDGDVASEKANLPSVFFFFKLLSLV